MSWVKIDDNFAEHPKVLAAGPIAGWLHVAALCYSARHLTDGFIPVASLATLASFDGVGLTREGQLISTPMRVDPRDVVAILVATGLWHEEPGGYRIHDYLDFNPSKTAVQTEREHIRQVRSEAGRRSGLVRRSVFVQGSGVRQHERIEQTPNKARTKREQKGNPVPVPVPEDAYVSSAEETPAGGFRTKPKGGANAVITALMDAIGRRGIPGPDEKLKRIVGAQIRALLKGGYDPERVRHFAVELALSWDNAKGHQRLLGLRQTVLQDTAEREYAAHEEIRRREAETQIPASAEVARAMFGIAKRMPSHRRDKVPWSARCNAVPECLRTALYGAAYCSTHIAATADPPNELDDQTRSVQ